MAKDVEVGGNSDNGNDETVKRSLVSKKPNVSTEYFTFLHSKKRWVFFDNFWPLLKLLVKSTIEKAIKQSSYWAMQDFYPNRVFINK